jgi:hypothetical protein
LPAAELIPVMPCHLLHYANNMMCNEIPLSGTCFPVDNAALIQSIPEEMLTYKRKVLVVQGIVVLAPGAHECSTTGENKQISLIQWYQKCATQSPRDPQSVARGSRDILL